MLINRVMMVHVELHHPDDSSKVRDEATENSCFVHGPKGSFGRVTRGQEIQKKLVRFGIRSEIVVDKLERRADEPDCLRMQQKVIPLGLNEKANEIEWIFFKNIALLYVETAVINAERGRRSEFCPGAPRQGAHEIAQCWHGLQLPQLKAGTNNPGQVADILGD